MVKGNTVIQDNSTKINLPNSFKKLFQAREALIFLIVLVCMLVLTVLSPHFLTKANITAVLLGVSIEAIMAISMTMLIVIGGLDLSVGSVLALAGMVCGLLIRGGMLIWLSILIALAVGTFLGFINSVIIAKVGVNPFVTTLGMMSIARGLVYIVTEGQPVVGIPKGFTNLGQNYFLGLQLPIWYMIILVIVGDILLRKLRFLRQNYYIGGNEKSALLCGINVDRMKMFNYTLSGFLSALAGVIMTARIGTASVSAGTGIELRVIAAVVIGGASLSGGEGTILGAFLGALFMGIISNALNLLGISVYWQQLVIGLVLILAVILDTVGKKKQNIA